MAHRIPIIVRQDNFEGPLDLLLFLIQSQDLDISRISIGRITDQYLAYVRLMQELNFDTASEFLVMAATLLHWKSKALLPREEEAGAKGEDSAEALSQEELIRQLLEHQRFLAAGEELSRRPRLGEDVFIRNNGKPPVEKVWKEMSLTDLTLAYQDTLARARKRSTILKKETVSITDMILEFGHKLEVGQPTALSKIISAVAGKTELVAAFLASLELGRLKKLRLHQEKAYEDIYLELLESLEGFDPRLASGFSAEVEKLQEENPAPTGLQAEASVEARTENEALTVEVG